MHVNDELLREGRRQGESQIMLMMVFEGGGGEGEIEDRAAFNIQDLVKSSDIYFNSSNVKYYAEHLEPC